MTRIPVTERIAEILAQAPTHEASGFPSRYTYRGLAAKVYDTADPAPAQLSAVRRAVARLVADGCAERDVERAWGGDGWHERTITGRRGMETEYQQTYSYRNPGGVLIQRPMTEADREARAAVMASSSLADNERVIARGTKR